MKRTAIFIGDELYELLWHEAFRAKTSMAEMIRVRLQGSIDRPRSRRDSKDPILKVAGVAPARSPQRACDQESQAFRNH